MRTQRATRRALALAIAVLGLGGLVGPQAAADAPALAVSAPVRNVAVDMPTTPVDPNARGSLKIHKYVVPGDLPPGTEGTGVESPVPPGAQPLAGVTFAIARVEGVDLTTAEGWQKVEDYQGHGMGGARANLGPSIVSAPTDAQGITTVADLPIGLYLVHEQSILTRAGDDDPTVIPSPDFLVTLPLAHPDRTDQWMYDLHLYPKDSRVQIVKQLLDGNVGIPNEDAPVAGHVLTYINTATIPADGLRVFGGHCERPLGTIDVRHPLDEFGFTPTGDCAPDATYVGTAHGAAYEIIDDLTISEVAGTNPTMHTSDFLTFATDDWAGDVVVELTGQPAPLKECDASMVGCDYTLTQTPTADTISMTDAGLIKIATAKANNPSATVKMTVQAKVLPTVTTVTASRMLGNPDVSGASALAPQPRSTTRLAAPALFRPGQAAPAVRNARLSTPGIPAANPLTLVLPDIALLVPTGAAKANHRNVPSNMVRTIYANILIRKVDQADGGNLRGAVFSIYRTREDAEAERNPLAKSTLSGADGMAVFNGLHVTDFQNDTDDNDNYWIVETKAPSGYVANPTPFEIHVKSDGTAERADGSGPIQVPNPKLTTIAGVLAYTGSNIGWLLGVGLCLVALGMVFGLVAHRRGRREARVALP